MFLGAKSAMQTRQESRRLGGFGKKWNSGDTVTAFYRIFKDAEGLWDIAVAQVWGHNIDPKAIGLKRVFIPTNSEMVNGEPTTVDAMAQFARIAPLFVKGEYNIELEKIRSKAGKLSEAVLKQQEKELDDKYQVEDGRIGKSPAIGNLRLVVSTEVVVVKHGDSGAPKIEEAALVTQDLSDARIRKLRQVLNSPDIALSDDATYVEVTYSFGTSGNRSKDAQCDPIGVKPGYRMEERYPQAWLTVSSIVESLPTSSQMIEKRNSSYKPESEQRIIQAIQSYSIMNSELLDALSEEEDIERLTRNARLLRSLAVESNIAEVNQAILADIEVEKKEEELKAIAEARLQGMAPVVKEEASNLEKEEASTEGAPTMEHLLSQEEIQQAKENNESDLKDIGDELV